MRERRLASLGLAVALCCCAWSAPARALQVPLIVQELLPAGTAGRLRATEPVSVGVPLDVREGITDVGQLGLFGASAAQFRVLERDRGTGRIRWVLVDFMADSPGGNYTLVDGAGSFGGLPLATDGPQGIVVATGAARFEIRKSGFNLIDRVVQGGDEVVASHEGGGVVVLAASTRYESGLDAGSQVVLEENGPVKAVIRARGVLRSVTGVQSLAYTVRLHFYRGKGTCRAFVTLRNADIGSPKGRLFDAAWVEVPLRLGSQRQLQFGTTDSTFTANLGSGDSAHLFQGDNDFQHHFHTDGILPFLTPALGLEMAVGGGVLKNLGASTDMAQGWMRLEDSRHTFLAGMRDLATFFPSGFDISGNIASIEIFSRHNPQRNLVFSWGAHETRELLLQFGDPSSKSPEFHAALQYPLAARCDFARYRDTGAFCGERRLVTADEEEKFFADQGKKWRLTDLAQTDIKLDRQYSFGATGGPNQFDKDECDLIDFARTGYGGRYLQGRLGVLYKSDLAVPHSDDFDYGEHQNGISDIRADQPISFHGKGAGSLFDDEHPHWVCMLHYYHMTGDENVREAIEDYGEWRLYRAGHPLWGAVNGGAVQHFRLWSRCFRDVALLYEFTGQTRYLDALHRMGQVLTGTLEKGTSKGRNLERGYFYFGDETNPTRLIHLFYLTEMNPLAVQEAMRVLPETDPMREELRDYLYGLAYFTLQEAQISPTAIGYPYEYLSALPNTVLGVRGDQTGLVLTHGYEMSGDTEFVNRSRKLAWHVLEYQSALRASELSTHLRIHRWLHRDEVGALLLDPQVTRNPDSSYTLRWKAPEGARQYIVKYGPRPLVENLGYDQLRRTYHIDPASAMNFWAAANLQGEPRPGWAGAQESFTTPPLSGSTWYFKIKVLTSGGTRELPFRLGDLHPRGGVPSDPARGPRRPPAAPGSPSPGAEEPGWSRAHATRVAASPVGPGRGAAISFAPLAPDARLRIYSVNGRLVRELAAEQRSRLVWDRRSRFGTTVAPGLYLYRVESGLDRTQQGRLILMP